MSLSYIFNYIWTFDLLSVAGGAIALIVLGVIVVVGLFFFMLSQEAYSSIINKHPKIEKFIDRTIGVIAILAIGVIALASFESFKYVFNIG